MNDPLSIRLSSTQMRKLDELAAKWDTTRSQAVRRLIDDATRDVAATIRRLSREEALDLLHEQARAGRVSALSEVLRQLNAEDPRSRAFAALEQLAAERRQ